MRISDWSSDVCSSDLLRGAEHMARRHEAHADIADPDLFAIADGLRMSRLAITRAHDGERLRRGEHMAVAAARMVRMAVGDERAFRRKRRSDPEIPRRHEIGRAAGRGRVCQYG